MTTVPEEQSESVLEELNDNVLLLTLNRTDARNAVNADLALRLGLALARADRDPEVRAVVLTGAGTRAFCAGADLKAVARGERVSAEGHPEWGFAGVVAQEVGVPLIAAVNGAALGGGLELVLTADLAVAARSATFGLPEVARGLVAGGGGAFRLPDSVPRKLAHELLLTGATISASRALEVGLVNRVVEDDDVLASALTLGHRIAANAPLAVRASKRIARGWTLEEPSDERRAWRHTRDHLAVLARSEDLREGAVAFAEKRAPVWRGR